MIRREGQVGDLNKVRHKDSIWKVPLPTETMCLVIQKSLQKIERSELEPTIVS